MDKNTYLDHLKPLMQLMSVYKKSFDQSEKHLGNLMDELNNPEKEKNEENMFHQKLDNEYKKFSFNLKIGLFIFALFWTLLAYLLFTYVWIPKHNDFTVLDMRFDICMAAVYYILCM